MNDSMQKQLDLYGQLIIHPKGRSMLPFLREKRDAVMIVAPQRQIRKYDIALYQRDGVYILHRVIKANADRLVICGDNSCVSDIVERKDVIGIVSEIIQNSKSIQADRWYLRVCLGIWYGLGMKKAVFLCKKCLRRCKRIEK